MANNNAPRSLAEQVRGFIAESRLSQHQIARATGIRQPGLSKFLNGGSMKIETLDVLLRYLNIVLCRSGDTSEATHPPKERLERTAWMNEFRGLEGRTFSTILIDPPWRFTNRTGKMAPEHRRLRRYETLSLEEIKQLPVGKHVNTPSHLYLWCPNALLREGLDVMEAWGFKYKTNIVWYKVRKDGGPDGRGVGFYFRNVTELLLFGIKGSLRTLDAGRRQVNVIATRKREHSRKPTETYDIIEKCSPAPYLELFARERIEGWTCWGNEVDSYEENRPLYNGYNNTRRHTNDVRREKTTVIHT